jgi:hypothetical protein
MNGLLIFFLQCDREREELQRRREKVLALRESLTSGSTPKSKAKHKKSASVSSDPDRSAAAAAAAAALADVEERLDAAGTARVSASVLRQLILNFLNAQVLTSDDETPLYARQYDLCLWLHHANEHEQALKKKQAEDRAAQAAAPSASDISPAFERDLEACQLNWEPPSKNRNGLSGASASAAAPNQAMLIDRAAASAMSRQLSLERGSSVLKWSSRILDSLCARCNDPVPACRATAVAAIADMVRVDQAVLKVSLVQQLLAFPIVVSGGFVSSCMFAFFCMYLRFPGSSCEACPEASRGRFIDYDARSCRRSDRHVHLADAERWKQHCRRCRLLQLCARASQRSGHLGAQESGAHLA